MNKIKAVIFDMDGVIIDTESYNTKYYMKIFSEMGASTVWEDFHITQGGNSNSFWGYFSEKYNIEKPDEDTRHQHRLGFIEYLKEENAKAIPGVRKLISELYKNKIPIGIASSASKIRIEGQLKLTRLSKYFKTIICGQDVTHGKPDPEVFIKAAEKLNANPKNCLVIEDSTNGVRAGKAAGMTVVGFAGSPHNKQDLSEADKIIYSFKELTSDIIHSL